MSPKPGSLLIVHMIEDQPESSEFERSKWPLHITLIPWFDLQDTRPVITELKKVQEEVRSFSVVVGEQELFGPNQDIPVNVIQDQAQLLNLHERLFEALLRLRATFQESQFMGSKFRAHITRQQFEDRHRNPEDVIAIDNFCLVELLTLQTCRVIHRFDLIGSGHEAAA